MLAASWLSVLLVELTVTVTGEFAPTWIWNMPGEIVVLLLVSAPGELRRLHHPPFCIFRGVVRVCPSGQATSGPPGAGHSGGISGAGCIRHFQHPHSVERFGSDSIFDGAGGGKCRAHQRYGADCPAHERDTGTGLHTHAAEGHSVGARESAGS